ncbi:MAG TPA: MlaD family protein [Kofleriaceae bacterium]|nr:MlaD family protein [Kofleriaceae bacterium]
MRDRGTEFKVGLLILVGLVVFAGFIFLLGNFSFRSGYTLHVDYDFSGNIQPGAPVKVSGIKVGKVEEVAFLAGKVDPATGRRVQVRLDVWVEDRIRDAVRQDAEFFINTSGVLGEQYLEIVPGDDYARPPLGEGATVRGVDPPRTDLIIARLYVVLDSLSSVLTDERDFIRNLLVNGAGVVGELNTLLAENRAELGALIASGGDLAGQAAITLGKVNQGLDDPAVIGRAVRHADAVLVSANSALTDLNPPARSLLGELTRVARSITNERIERTIRVADGAVGATGKATRLIENVDGMVGDLRKGKGTAGALLVREEVYADLREMIRDLKRNPWKFFWKE